MTAIPGPLQSLVFRNADLPALFHHTDAIAIARQREAVNTTRWQLILLVAGAIPAALPWHWEVADTFQLTDSVGVLAYLGVLITTYLSSRRKAKSHWQLNRSAASSSSPCAGVTRCTVLHSTPAPSTPKQCSQIVSKRDCRSSGRWGGRTLASA